MAYRDYAYLSLYVVNQVECMNKALRLQFVIYLWRASLYGGNFHGVLHLLLTGHVIEACARKHFGMYFKPLNISPVHIVLRAIEQLCQLKLIEIKLVTFLLHVGVHFILEYATVGLGILRTIEVLVGKLWELS